MKRAPAISMIQSDGSRLMDILGLFKDCIYNEDKSGFFGSRYYSMDQTKMKKAMESIALFLIQYFVHVC